MHARGRGVTNCGRPGRERNAAMRYRLALTGLALFLWLGLSAWRSWAYVEERYTLARVVNESTNIVLVRVEKVNKEKKLIYYRKVADLKGKHEPDLIKHNVGV